MSVFYPVSADASLQSLTHGEMNFPNGNVSKDEVAIEQGLPQETPKQVNVKQRTLSE